MNCCNLINLDSHVSEIQSLIDKYHLNYYQWSEQTATLFKSRFCRNLSADDWSEIEWCMLYLLRKAEGLPTMNLSELRPVTYYL